MKVLVVDDDRDLVDLLTFALGRAGFAVAPAFDSPTALKLLEAEEPSIAVIDINLGRWNGFDLLQELRRRSKIPVIMLTARGSEDDKVHGLELGADDYLTKPFSHRELVARVRSHLRRHGQEWSVPVAASPILEVGPVKLNVAEHTVTKSGRLLDLTVTEFRLLRLLIANAGTVVATRDVLRQVWGHSDLAGAEVVRVTVHRLRQKIEDDPSQPQLLHTVPGVGLVVKPPA